MPNNANRIHMESERISTTINRMGQHWIIPKKFLCRYDLSTGAMIYGVLYIVVMIACIITAVVEMLSFKTCSNMSYAVKRSAYGFSSMAIIFSVLLVAVNSWFLWGVQKKKSSVVLIWVASTSLWLVLATCLTTVLLCVYMADTTFLIWIMSAIFAIVAFVICLYGILVGLGLWLKLKNVQEEPNPT